MYNQDKEIFLKAIPENRRNEIKKNINNWESWQQKSFSITNLFDYLISVESDEEWLAKIFADAFGVGLISEPSLDFDIHISTVKSLGMVVLMNELYFPYIAQEGKVCAIACHPFVSFPGIDIAITHVASRQTILSLLDRACLFLEEQKIDPAFLSKDDPRYFFLYTLQRAIRLKGSDIHFEYYPRYKDCHIKLRKDGLLQNMSIIHDPGMEWYSKLINHFFYIANMDAGVYHKIYDKQIEEHLFKHADPYALRLSSLPVLTHQGMAIPQICLRIAASKEESLSSLQDLGFSEQLTEKIHKDILNIPYGLVYVCGPTGSGKNTTLYACLDILLRESSLKILSIEDPVEKKLFPPHNASSGIIQVEVNEKRGISFASALRSFLRHDPDVIFIGETRDEETAQIAVNAALTGHLVFSTLHVNSSYDVISRLIDTLGVKKDLLSSALKGVISQRLVRTLCSCAKSVALSDAIGFKEKYSVSGVQKIHFYSQDILNIYSHITGSDHFMMPVGCPKCNHTGFVGRTVLPELLPVTARNHDFLFGQQRDKNKAFVNEPVSEFMYINALDMVKKGITSLSEVARFINFNELNDIHNAKKGC